MTTAAPGPEPRTHATGQPSPEHFFETVTAYQRTAAVRAAVELDFFTAIGEGASTPAALAGRLKISERGARVLADYLTVHGFLSKAGGHFALTPDSAAFLDRRSPAYMGGAIEFMLSPTLTGAFEKLTEVVRTGTTQLDPGGTVAPDHPVWVKFARAMAPLMGLPAEGIAQLLRVSEMKKCRVLDIAAGHGLFGITLARHNPQAEITAVDWPGVLELAKENAARAGVAARYHTRPGNAFEVDFGSGYNVALLTNFLHHFDPPTNEQLLRKVHAALAPGGRAAILEFVPDDNRTTPPISAGFALTMLASTPAGDAYTFAELERMAAAAGFARSELHPLPPTFQRVIISYK